jgi:serine/threonine-protein kinase
VTLELKPGLVIGERYTLREPLGTGGQGEVWSAIAGDDTLRAVKRFTQSRRSRDLLADGVVAAKVADHEHLVSTLDIVDLGAALFVVMNVVAGRRLSELCPVSDEELFATVLVQVGAALAHLHGSAMRPGVAHRDVKPDNILVQTGTETGTGLPHATLVDLGMLLVLDGSRDGRHGVLEFTAPDALLAERYVAEDDVYALGAVGWHMLCGEPPHVAAGIGKEAFARRVVTRRLAEVADEIPSWAIAYEDVLARALITASPHPARHHGERRPTAAQVIEQIAGLAWPDGAPAPIQELLAQARAGLDGAPEQPPPIGLATPDPPGPGLLVLARDRALASAAQVGRGALAVRIAYAELAQRAGRSAEALGTFRSAARQDSPYAMVRAAEALQEAHPAEARELLERADTLGSARAALLLGRLQLGVDPDASRAAFERAARRGSADGAWELARALGERGEAEGAARAAALAVELHHPQATLRAAEDAEGAGRISEAERLFNRTGMASARHRLGLIHQRRGDLRKAESCLRWAYDNGCAEVAWQPLVEVLDQAPERDPWPLLHEAATAGFPGAQLQLGCWLMYFKLDSLDANATLRAAFAEGDGPPQPVAVRALAVSELACGRPEAARELLAAAAAEPSPPLPDGALVAASAHLAAGDRAAAVRAIDDASLRPAEHAWTRQVAEPALRELADESPTAAFHLADCLRLRVATPWSGEQRDEIRHWYAHSRATQNPLAYAWYAWAIEDPETRYAAMTEAAERGDTWAMWDLAPAGEATNCWLLRAAELGHAAATGYLGILIEADEPDRALELFRQADAAGDARAARNLARALVPRLGWRHPDVEAALSRADVRGNAGAADELGTLLWDAHRDGPSSLAAHLRAGRRDSSNGWLNAGVMHETLGDDEAAEDAYRRAIAAGAEDAKAWLGLLIHKREGIDPAVKLGREAVAANPSNCHVHYELARLLRERGETAEMIKHLRRADELGDAWAAYDLSFHLGPAEAHAALDRAAHRARDARDPLYLYVADKLELLRYVEERRMSLPVVGVRAVRFTVPEQSSSSMRVRRPRP